MKKRIVFMIIGNILIGIGISFLNLSGFGVDAFTSMTIGLSSLLGIGLGIFQSGVNILLFIPVIFFNRKSFGLGSLVNMFLLGYIVEYLEKFYAVFGITQTGLKSVILLRILLLLAGIVILCFGCAIYMECHLGTGPYDAIAPIIENRTHGKIKFQYARIGSDLTCAIIGFISGMIADKTTVGIATVCVVLFTGPLIGFFRDHVTSRILA